MVSWSSTKIAILVPSRAKSGNTLVTTAGEASNGEAFTFYPYPAITGVSPASGAAGTIVTITGTSLLDGGGDGIVTFNGIPAAILSQSSTSIHVNVPPVATTGVTVREDSHRLHHGLIRGLLVVFEAVGFGIRLHLLAQTIKFLHRGTILTNIYSKLYIY